MGNGLVRSLSRLDRIGLSPNGLALRPSLMDCIRSA
eukprot:CAMPEP_0180255530 /NCGR_PEP_ID=MMETSP0987-20121128/40774_1 /TAXON_ID=697907 /ORGANISM="non described non described, Strain CCMP2293" /LENGTH=35 /DNA_ID= /DNA_START= /DNA_END= /DNA_ORIENTATION=